MDKMKYWINTHKHSMRAIFVLWRYWFVDLAKWKSFNSPTECKFLFFEHRITSILKHQLPELRIDAVNGMAEHYGYPRHLCYIVFWWKKRGYALGFEWIAQQKQEAGSE